MGTGIQVMVGIPNEMLSTFDSDLFVQQNLSRFIGKNGADIRYVAVGNEPFLTGYGGQFQELCNAYESNVPSQGMFRPELTQIMTQLLAKS
ncbi:Glycoside hydrolase superfamily [Arabidopsis suecica]|uniref:Glycoside hydrolase superfamily n=1 Tax=Arabidopsis suecica TaxID=45249 RepID=A0A8T1YM15_ARASU|nr:Glycoside hydrolase superfamily [Arabidopsis suecica]